MTPEKYLHELVQKYVHNKSKENYRNIALRLVANTIVWVPMNMAVSPEDILQFLMSKKGDVVSTKNEIRMKPDILKDPHGRLYFPIFTSTEEAPVKYRNNFSWIQVPFKEVLKQARQHKDVDAVVINAFSNNVSFPLTMLKNMVMRESMASGLIGLAVGESSGIPFSFVKRSRLKEYPVTDPYGMEKPYIWGEITALTLATMDSIVKTGKPNFNDTMDRFLAWLENGKYCPLVCPADVSITVKYSIMRYKNGMAPLACGANDRMSCGAASMARILPIAYYLYRKGSGRDDQIDLINHMSSLIYRQELSWLGCMILSDYVGCLLDGFSKTEALRHLQDFGYRKYYTDDSCDAFGKILSGEIAAEREDEIHSSANIVDVLEASLWCILNTENYQDAVTKAVNLGGATAYICAVTGAMAGILYGRRNIPQRWIDSLQDRPYLTDEIYRFANFL